MIIWFLGIIEWTPRSFSMGKLRTFYSFQVPYLFQGELYKIKVVFFGNFIGFNQTLSIHVLGPVLVGQPDAS